MNDKHIKQGFKIPDNYFDEFRNKLPEIIKEHESIKQPSIRISPTLYLVAASIILLIVSVFTFIPQNNTIDTKTTVAHQVLPDAEYYDLDIDDLYYAYNEGNSGGLEEAEPALDKEALVDYLADASDLDELILLSE